MTTSTPQTGKIFIASMNLRGKWATPIVDSIKLNVTSAQGKLNQNRLSFSPMTEIPGGYKGYWNYESRWQSGKIYNGIDDAEVKAWWKKQTAPKRRYPKGKGKKILCARFEGFEHMGDMDYVTARKEVYLKEYYDLIKDKERIQYYEQKLKEGNNITIYDFDGPRTEDGDVLCLELDLELLRTKIEYTSQPFGHGYIVGARLLGFVPEDFGASDK
jgi:hypothetical protein